jgi:hypothetical protein
MNSTQMIIIVFLAGVVIYLIYSENNQKPLIQKIHVPVPQKCPSIAPGVPKKVTHQINVNSTPPEDIYADPIKRQDLYHLYDPLTYPQTRLPRDILHRYQQYFKENGVYPPFNYATQPELFDNPIHVGFLTRDPDTETVDNVPNALPLFRVKSTKNANRYHYYTLDQRYGTKIDVKIPFDDVEVNGQKYHNSDYYGIPELFDDDTIKGISVFPNTLFRVKIYKTYHFP